MEEKLEQPKLETSIEEKLQELEIQEGSMLGKFKDTKSLLEAYNNLESEFTRKCQKLSEVQRENEKLSSKQVIDEYASIDDFISRNADMDKYKKEITEILTDEDVSNLPNKYQVAYLIAKQSESKSVNRLNDPEFLDNQIKNNSKIKDKIICDYLSNLNNFQASPTVMSGNANNIFFSPKSEKPKTIREAGELFSKMLK